MFTVWLHPCLPLLLEDPSPSPCFLSSPKATSSVSCHSRCHQLLHARSLEGITPVTPCVCSQPPGLPVAASAS